MKKLFSVFLLVTAVFIVVGLTSCATASSVGGVSSKNGIFTGNGATAVLTEGAEEIASYSVILGIVDTGYADYAAAVKAAEAAGKKITSVTKWLFVMTKTTAYAQ